MQELIINILLCVLVVTAAGFLITANRHKNSMTKKQKKMLTRILIASAMLLGLQFLTPALLAQMDSYLFPSAGRWMRFAL